MKQIHRIIVRMLPGPFFGWLATLMFLLVMQFLIRYLPDLVGRGLPVRVMLEIIVYNLAYMVVLAVPMSTLIATLMTFGKLAETNAYAVMKGAGVSLGQLIWPAFAVGLLLTCVMWYFNSNVLPSANYQASTLWKDIRRKKPGFELEAGVFYDGISNYNILVRDLPPESNELFDITIYDYSDGSRRQTVIKAAQGHIETLPDGSGVDLVLEDGEMHRLHDPNARTARERYERFAFDRHRLTLDLSEFSFERSEPSNGYRSDRTMRSVTMIRLVDSLKMSTRTHRLDLHRTILGLTDDSTWQPDHDRLETLPVAAADTAAASSHFALAGLAQADRRNVFEHALSNVRARRSQAENLHRNVEWELQRADKYWVEIHKKYSIAVACLIFMLIGAPLGLSIRRGGLGTAGATALGIFMFYWVTLVQGEKLSDRGLLVPWVGMWAANIVVGLVGLGLLAYVLFDLRAVPLFRDRRPRFRKAAPSEAAPSEAAPDAAPPPAA